MAANTKLSPMEKLVLASNRFSFKLHQKLSDSSKNLFYSPLSLSTACALLYRGAEGRTKAEIGKVLEYDAADTEGFKEILESCGQSREGNLDIAHSVLIQKDFPVRSEYVDDLRRNFQAVAKNVDFAGRGEEVKREINSWVAEKTKHKINRLVDSISPSTQFMLLSAVYFKGTWEHPFEFERTVPMPFYNNGVSQKMVPMMNITNENYKYAEMADEDLQVLQLPFKGGLSMWILLPHQMDGMGRLEERLSDDLLSKAMDSARDQDVQVVSLPKFTLQYSTEISGVLCDLGMPSICAEPDFGGICSSYENVRVTEILHKTFIEVNEEGSEAAAVTMIAAGGCCRDFGPRKEFVANHPFLFFIIDDRNGLVLFRGRLSEL